MDMEVSFENQAFIVAALEAHIKSLKEECELLNEPLVTNTVNQRIEGITPILAAMSCGEYALELVEA